MFDISYRIVITCDSVNRASVEQEFFVRGMEKTNYWLVYLIAGMGNTTYLLFLFQKSVVYD